MKNISSNQNHSWRFVTTYSHVLVCIAADPSARLRDIAETVGITERTAAQLVRDLEEAGYLTKTRIGRRNRYEVHDELPLRHPLHRHHTVGGLIRFLQGPVGKRPVRSGFPKPSRDLTAAAAATEGIRPTLAHPLRTERLTLRAASTADADGTWAYRRLESVGQWLTEIPTDLEAYRAAFTDPARLAATVIVEHPDGTLLGDFTLRLEDAWAQADLADQARDAQAELGWVLDPAHTRHGYATEAVRELITHCFDQLGVRRVIATCFLANDASWRLMERLGMRRECHAVAESLHRSGQWLDTVTYAVLAEEWAQADRWR